MRRPGEEWHEPEVSKYSSEEALQDLLMASPALLPTATGPMAIVKEFTISNIGRVDLVGVDESGGITIVECKLKANPEIRREVVGQAFAYAGGLWRMGYDQFDATFSKLAGRSTAAAVAAVAESEFEEQSFREAVTKNLRDGTFRLVIAVDEITPELKLIIEYVNGHTVGSVQVLAFELRYTKDGDVEILVPNTFGLELAERSAATGGAGWTQQSFAAEIERRTSGAARAMIERLLQHGQMNGHHPFYGSGHTPGMSHYYELDGKPTSVWALYLNEAGPKIALSLGAVAKDSPSRALSFLEELRHDANLGAVLADASVDKYPSLPVEGLLDQQPTQDAFFAALDRLIG